MKNKTIIKTRESNGVLSIMVEREEIRFFVHRLKSEVQLVVFDCSESASTWRFNASFNKRDVKKTENWIATIEGILKFPFLSYRTLLTFL